MENHAPKISSHDAQGMDATISGNFQTSVPGTPFSPKVCHAQEQFCKNQKNQQCQKARCYGKIHKIPCQCLGVKESVKNRLEKLCRKHSG